MIEKSNEPTAEEIAAGLKGVVLFQGDGGALPAAYDQVLVFGAGVVRPDDQVEFVTGSQSMMQNLLAAIEIATHNRSKGSLDVERTNPGELSFPDLSGRRSIQCAALVLVVRGRKLRVQRNRTGGGFAISDTVSDHREPGSWCDVRLWGDPDTVFNLLLSFRTVLQGAERRNAVVEANQAMMAQVNEQRAKALKPGEMRIVTDVLKHGN